MGFPTANRRFLSIIEADRRLLCIAIVNRQSWRQRASIKSINDHCASVGLIDGEEIDIAVIGFVNFNSIVIMIDPRL
jgi:hypothetical protein